jgi:redox-sensing transcriptional repressor
MTTPSRIPGPTAKRLSLYLRELETETDPPRRTISSRQLGEALGLTDAQVRKDLAHFGQFGQPGIGYRIDELRDRLRGILGTDRSWRVVVIGAGNIGRAVVRYDRLVPKGFEVVGVFDDDPAIVGTRLNDHRVDSVEQLGATVETHGVEIGMLAVPAAAAQQVADEMIACGIRGILNFAPVRLSVPEHVAIVSVDLTASLEQLAFKMSLHPGSGPADGT